MVKFPDGCEARYHVNHVKAQATRGTVKDGEDCDPFAGEAENYNDQVPIIVEEPAGNAPEETEEPQAPEVHEPLMVPHVPAPHRSLRHRAPPDYYGTRYSDISGCTCHSPGSTGPNWFSGLDKLVWDNYLILKDGRLEGCRKWFHPGLRLVH